MARHAQDGQLFHSPNFSGFGPSRFHPNDVPPGGEAVHARGRKLRDGVLALAPRRPGIYAMLDRRSQLLYVGKAKCLRNRLASYFRPDSRNPKAAKIIGQTRTLLWEYAPHELGALLRELELIQRHRPRYNVKGLSDLRTYCYVAWHHTAAPGLTVVREPAANGHSTFYGPFLCRHKVEAAVRRLNDSFRLRDCPSRVRIQFADEPPLFETDSTPQCLRVELGTCLGPCSRACTRRTYALAVAATRRFLDGTDRSLLDKLKQKMLEAAKLQQYELARACRDKLADLEWLDLRLNMLRRSREQSSFIYPVQTQFGQQLWYLLHRGSVWGTTWAPASQNETCRVLKLLEKMLAEQTAPAVTTTTVDSVLLLARWFRKHHTERTRLEPANQTIARLRSSLSAASVIRPA